MIGLIGVYLAVGCVVAWVAVRSVRPLIGPVEDKRTALLLAGWALLVAVAYPLILIGNVKR